MTHTAIIATQAPETLTLWADVVSAQLSKIQTNKKATIKDAVQCINAATGLTVVAGRTKAVFMDTLLSLVAQLQAVNVPVYAESYDEWEELSPCGTMSMDEWEDLQVKKERTAARIQALVDRCPINTPIVRSVDVQVLQLPVVAEVQPSRTGVAIDSATITIPLDRVKIVSSVLRSLRYEVTVDPETGEFTDTNPREVDSYNHQTMGVNGVDAAYSTKYIKSRVGGKNQKTIEVLSLTVQSKQLQKHYLEGIHAGTMVALYKSIMSEGVVAFSYEDFKKARISDIDIKQDVELPSGVPFMQFAEGLMEKCNKTIFGMESFESPKLFGKKGNKTTGEGFQMGTRDKKAKKPMVKVYNKKVELATKSATFYGRFLADVPVSKEIRYEISFKNRSNLEKYGILDRQEPVSLQRIIDRLDNRCSEAFQNIRSEYLCMGSMPEATGEGDEVGELVEESGLLDLNKIVSIRAVVDVIAELTHKADGTTNEAKTHVSRALGLLTEEDRKKARKKIPLKKIDEYVTYRMQELRNGTTKSNFDKFPEQLRYAMISFIRATDHKAVEQHGESNESRDQTGNNPIGNAVIQEVPVGGTVRPYATVEHVQATDSLTETLYFECGGNDLSISANISRAPV